MLNGKIPTGQTIARIGSRIGLGGVVWSIVGVRCQGIARLFTLGLFRHSLHSVSADRLLPIRAQPSLGRVGASVDVDSAGMKDSFAEL